MHVFVLLLTLGSAPAFPTCQPAPLPEAGERSEAFWLEYLNDTLHRCFDRVSDLVKRARVLLVDGASFEISCQDSCELQAGRELLAELGAPEDAVFLLGHEAAHTLFFFKEEFRILSEMELELAADMMGARSVDLGGCYGARTLRMIDEANSHRGPDETMPGRILALQADCALGGLLKKR